MLYKHEMNRNKVLYIFINRIKIEVEGGTNRKKIIEKQVSIFVNRNNYILFMKGEIR